MFEYLKVCSVLKLVFHTVFSLITSSLFLISSYICISLVVLVRSNNAVSDLYAARHRNIYRLYVHHLIPAPKRKKSRTSDTAVFKKANRKAASKISG